MIIKLLIALLLFSGFGYSQIDSVKNIISFGVSYNGLKDGSGIGILFNYSKLLYDFNLLGNITFIDLIFIETNNPSDPRYYRDYFSNGQSRCRDSETGRFVVSELCDDEIKMITKYSINLELNYMFSKGIKYLIGIGLRISNPFTPYGTLGLLFDSIGGLYARLNLGYKYWSLGANLYFDLARWASRKY